MCLSACLYLCLYLCLCLCLSLSVCVCLCLSVCACAPVFPLANVRCAQAHGSFSSLSNKSTGVECRNWRVRIKGHVRGRCGQTVRQPQRLLHCRHTRYRFVVYTRVCSDPFSLLPPPTTSSLVLCKPFVMMAYLSLVIGIVAHRRIRRHLPPQARGCEDGGTDHWTTPAVRC